MSKPASETQGALAVGLAGVLSLIASAVHPGFKEASGPATAQAFAGASVIVAAFFGWVAHRLGALRVSHADLAADVTEHWPEIRELAAAGKDAAEKVPGLTQAVTDARATADRVAAELSAATDGISAEVAAQVQKQFSGLLAQLAQQQGKTLP